MGSKVLFLAYDGMTEPLGQSQVLSYLDGLILKGHQIHLISFEKQHDFDLHGKAIEERTKAAGIVWHSLIYTKKPPIFSTMFDLYRAWLLAKKLHKEVGFDIVHGRGYMTSIVARHMQKRFGIKFIFDMRGWWPDEKLESGHWKSNLYRPVYDYYKKLEAEYFINADCTISLTHAGKDEIIRQYSKPGASIPVIPTCVNFKFFPPFDDDTRKQIRNKLDIPLEDKVLLYSGSIGGNYSTDTLFEIFSFFKKSDSVWHLLILSNTDRKIISDAMTKFSLTNEDVKIKGVSYKDVSKYLMAGDIGLIYYNVSFSVIGRSPTKMAEYWSAGLPVLSLKGIGDLDFLVDKYPQSGFMLSDISAEQCAAASNLLLEFAKNKTLLRSYAFDYFDVEKGIESYNKIYCDLVDGDS